MDENYMVWDGSLGRILSGGWHLMTDEKFALSFEYAALFYEPAAGNRFYVGEDGARRELSVAQAAEVRDLCEHWWEEQDFRVHAYDPGSGLYEGEMLRSLADRDGLPFRVEEAPEHPASKWTGGRWERVAMSVLDDGRVQEWPGGLCSHCVWGYTAEERAALPERPGMHHRFDVRTASWVDPRTLEEARLSAISSLRADFELLRHASSADRIFTPAYEAETWTWQVLEARAWLADSSVETPYIDAFLDARTDDAKPGKGALCEDIIRNHEQFLQDMAEVNAAQWGFLARVKGASTNEECDALYAEAHAFCAEARAELEA